MHHFSEQHVCNGLCRPERHLELIYAHCTGGDGRTPSPAEVARRLEHTFVDMLVVAVRPAEEAGPVEIDRIDWDAPPALDRPAVLEPEEWTSWRVEFRLATGPGWLR